LDFEIDLTVVVLDIESPAKLVYLHTINQLTYAAGRSETAVALQDVAAICMIHQELRVA
jgi:hypothetical protein